MMATPLPSHLIVCLLQVEALHAIATISGCGGEGDDGATYDNGKVSVVFFTSSFSLVCAETWGKFYLSGH